MNDDPRMQRNGSVESKRPEFVLSRPPPPRPKKMPTVHLDDPTYSAAHMSEGQEAMWHEEEASCTSTVIAAAVSKAPPISLRVEPPKKTLFNFGPSRSQPPKKQRFRKIQKSVVLLPQSDGRLNPLVGANAAQEAAVNMNKARSLLNQALTVEGGAPQLEDSEKMAKFAFVHAAVARRIMATVDEEATLDGYLENMSQKGEQATSDHQRIVFSMSFPDTPESKQPWTFSNAVDGYASQAKQYLESILPKNVDPSITEAMSEDIWSQGEISSLGFSAAYQLSTPVPHQQPLVHYVPPPKTGHFSDVLSMSSLNEILDGESEDDDDDDDEASESQSGEDSERHLPFLRSAVPVDIQLKKKNRFGIFSFGLLGSASDAKSKEESVIESRKEEEDERKSEDSVKERPDGNDLECPTDGQDIETIAVEKFTKDSKSVMFGVIRKAKSGGEKQKPQQCGPMPPKRQGKSHPTKQAGPNKARLGQNPLQEMPKKRKPGAVQILPSMPSRSIDSETEEGDQKDKYRTIEEVNSSKDEVGNLLENETPIVGEAKMMRARTQRTAEVDNICKLQVPQTAPTSPSTNAKSITSAEEEESQESIADLDEEPAEDKITPKHVRSLPKRLVGIFGGRRSNKADASASVESTPSTDIQNAMSEPSTDIQSVRSEEKAIENGISEEEDSQESIADQDEEPSEDKITPKHVRSLPKRLAGIFGGRRGNKADAFASVESSPSTDIQNAMSEPSTFTSEEKVIEKAISDGNTMALEANLNAEVAPRVPAQKPRLPPRSTRSVHSDVQLSVIHVQIAEVFPPLQESSAAISYNQITFAPGRQAEEASPVPRISYKAKDEPVQRESSKAKNTPVRQVKKEKNEPGGRVAAKEKEVPVRREATKEREAPVRLEATEEKERYVRSEERKEPLRREASSEKDQASKEMKNPIRGPSKDKEGEADRRVTIKDKGVPALRVITQEKREVPGRREAIKERDAPARREATEEKERYIRSKEREGPLCRKVCNEKVRASKEMKNPIRGSSKDKEAEADRRVTIKSKEIPVLRVITKEKGEEARRVDRKEMDAKLRQITGEAPAVRQDAPGREALGRSAPGRALKVSTSAKDDPPLKKGVSQNRNLAPTPRRVDDDSDSRFDQKNVTERLYGKRECDMSYTSSGTTTIDGSQETYAPELEAVTASYSSSDSGDGSETATKASANILSTMKQLWGRADS